MSQEELAYRIGLTQSDISKIEKGRTKQPDKKVLRKIAQVYGVSSNRLLMLADYAPDGYEEVASPEFALGPRVRYLGRVPADAVRWTAAVSKERTVPVQQEWIGTRSPDQFFVVRASGDCLMRCGIIDGTLVLCELAQGREPSQGQIVAVRVGDERSLKIWHRTDNGVELRDGDGAVVATLTDADDVEVVGFWVADWRAKEPVE